MNITMDKLLIMMFEKRASDLHIVAGAPPVLRIDGELRKINQENLTKEHCQDLRGC